MQGFLLALTLHESSNNALGDCNDARMVTNLGNSKCTWKLVCFEVIFKSLLQATSEGSFDKSTFIFCVCKSKYVISLWVFYLLDIYFIFTVVLWLNPCRQQRPPQLLAGRVRERTGRAKARKLMEQDTISLISEANLCVQAKQRNTFIHYSPLTGRCPATSRKVGPQHVLQLLGKRDAITTTSLLPFSEVLFLWLTSWAM